MLLLTGHVRSLSEKGIDPVIPINLTLKRRTELDLDIRHTTSGWVPSWRKRYWRGGREQSSSSESRDSGASDGKHLEQVMSKLSSSVVHLFHPTSFLVHLHG